MAEAPESLEGWYVLHDFRRVDWARWKGTRSKQWVKEATSFLESIQAPPEGGSALYKILGHKADLLFLHIRPTLEELCAVERAVEMLPMSNFMHRTYSYISVTELSLYEATARGGTDDREELLRAPFVQKRLKPAIPDMPYVSFYPMNKRRGEGVNWYTESLDSRRAMMREHASTGRKYAGQVQQMITGSTGMDDWEWGVTLHATDPLAIKKLVYEMRFDEVTAKYAEFGPFQLGIRLLPDELQGYFLG